MMPPFDRIPLKPYKILFVLGLFSFVLMLTPLADALEQAGRVIAIRGKVHAVDETGKSRSLKIKSVFYVQDTIKTGKKSRLQIMFKDNTIISLAAQTELKVSEYKFNALEKTGKINSQIKEGAFRIMGGLISKESPEEFKTTTPAGIIGIRGSMYAGSIRNGELTVLFEGGRGITLKNGTGMVLITKPGYISMTKGWNQSISKPRQSTTKDYMKLPSQMNRRNMLKKVLKSMKNPSPAQFSRVIKDAVQSGISSKEAEKLVEELKKDPEFGCK